MRKHLLLFVFMGFLGLTSCHEREVFITANTNLCPNCFNQYRFLDSIDDDFNLHLVFQNTNKKEAKKFSDKFFRITRSYDIVCDDSLYNSLSHNTLPWLYYYYDGFLVFDSELNQPEKWIPILNKLKNDNGIFTKTASLPDDVVLSEKTRCIRLKNNYLSIDCSYQEIHVFDENFNHIGVQDFSKTDYKNLYQEIFGNKKTWENVCSLSKEISRYVPDFGKIKIDNGCVYNDSLFLIVNVNYTEKYFNAKRNDSVVRVNTESAILGLDDNLEIHRILPLRFRDSLIFNDFSINAFENCIFMIKDWNNIILSVTQKESSEKHILCQMELDNGDIKFKSLIDNAFIPNFNEAHSLGTNLCLVKIDDSNAFFNVAPVITNYIDGKDVGLPFSNANAHFDLGNGVAEAYYILADAVQKSDGDFIIFYYLNNENKLSLIDDFGNMIWTVHLPKCCSKLYLIDEKTILYIDNQGDIFSVNQISPFT